MRDLESALVNSEVAQHGFGLERKQDLSELFGIGALSLSYCLHKELTPCVRSCGLKGGPPVELLLVRCDELTVSGVRETRFPKRAAVDELRLLSETLIIVGEQAIRQTAQ